MNKIKILQDLNSIEKNIFKDEEFHMSVDFEKFEFTIFNKKKTHYVPNPTPLKFHRDNNFVRFMMGPYNSGKSSAMCAEIIFRAISMPPAKDGIRHSRWAFIRNTYDNLWKTTYKTWEKWFSDLGDFRDTKKPLECRHIFRVEGIKEKIDLELWFIPLDRADDIGRFKSLEVTGVFLNELSELPQEALSHLKSRIPRFPSKDDIDCRYWSGIIIDSNPSDLDSWLYQIFEVERPDNYSLFRQPSGVIEVEDGKYIMNPEAENIQHQNNPNYYLDFIKGESKEFIKVYAMGEWGSISNEKKVFESYNDDIHAREKVESEKDSQLILGWDFGLTPACLIAQLTRNGQLRVLKEFCTSYLFVRELAENAVYPYLNSEFRGWTYMSIGDPSDRPSDSTYQSCLQTLQESGIYTTKAVTNNIVARIDAVSQFLNKLINGEPAIIISKEGCPNLRKGFLGKYNYKRLRVLGEKRFKDVPDKTHPYSDIQDCLQYICLEFYYNKQNKKDSDFFKTVPMWG